MTINSWKAQKLKDIRKSAIKRPRRFTTPPRKAYKVSPWRSPGSMAVLVEFYWWCFCFHRAGQYAQLLVNQSGRLPFTATLKLYTLARSSLSRVKSDLEQLLLLLLHPFPTLSYLVWLYFFRIFSTSHLTLYSFK